MHPYLLEHPFHIPSYGFMLAIGIVIGIFLAKKEAVRQDIDPQKIESLAFWVVLSSVLGSRFLYTFVEHGDYYLEHPLEFFRFDKGGLAFSGSLVTAVLSAIVFARLYKLPFWRMLDILSPPTALGLMFGKIGCFLAGCCYGKVCDLPWGIAFTHPETLAHPTGVPLHPTQIYEAISWLALFLFLYRFQKRETKPGDVFFIFAIFYGVGRFLLEFYRSEPGHIGALTTAQAFSIPLVLGAILFWAIRRKMT